MKTGETFQKIKQRQINWARSKVMQIGESSTGDVYATQREANLYIDLSRNSLDKFLIGAGKELDKKMSVLWSSSALVVNFFEYWFQAGKIATIASLCGAPGDASSMNYEKRYRTGKHGTAHLDLEFTDSQGGRFAIESKFTEPYRTEFNLDKYIAVEDYWKQLPECRQLAKRIVQDELEKPGYRYLDAVQLLKHILGLSYHRTEKFVLLYLWYDYDSPEAREHEEEISRFGMSVVPDVDFRSIKYQDLFAKIQSITDADQNYIKYLNERYF
jgi:hypothetical protein